MPLHSSVESTLRELSISAPGVPLLALGQTVFWDEPLKALVKKAALDLGLEVKLIAGVHDTDYFARLPGGIDSDAAYVALPKNDFSTKEFWSAAGEFSALFGSETPVTRSHLARAGVPLDRLTDHRQDALDEATEAWGWRGIASGQDEPPVVCDVGVDGVFPTLQRTFDWALQESANTICEPSQRAEALSVASDLQTLLCEARDDCPGQTLSAFYACLLPTLQRLATGVASDDVLNTTELLRFNPSTATLPRFEILDPFLNAGSSADATQAYNDSVQGTSVYTLDRFGTGAVPFEVVIPGEGRGTLRLTSGALIVMTKTPKVIPLNAPVEDRTQLASVLTEAVGDCVLVGKAITFIAMLSREFMFAFHEGASPYVSSTAKMLKNLRSDGHDMTAHPILRIGHDAWSALEGTGRWFTLPEPLRVPYGADEVSSDTLARTWRCVADRSRENTKRLAECKRPRDLIQVLDEVKGGRWENLSKEFRELGDTLRPLRSALKHIRNEIGKSHQRLRMIKTEWRETEAAMGAHFRSQLFRKEATSEATKKRDEFRQTIQELRLERRQIKDLLARLREQQAAEATAPDILIARRRRNDIQREAELARLRFVRGAVMAGDGLEKAAQRPAAWWFPLVSPSGEWIDNLLSSMTMRLEPLVEK